MSDETKTSTYNADQLEDLFHAALRKADLKGIDAALRLLALQNPHRAQALLYTLSTALEIARLQRFDEKALADE